MTITTTRGGPAGERHPGLDRLITAMLINLTIGVLATAVTLIFHDVFLADQLSAVPPGLRAGAREGLSSQLWTRPGPAVAVALLYPVFIRRLRALERRGYWRVVVVSVLQIAAQLWLLLAGTYPWWMRLVQVLQLAAAAAVLALATRAPVRTLFARPDHRPGGNARAAWLLVALAPVVAELALGSTPPRLAFLVLAWVPVYGAGVLLIRELVVRAGRGWPSLLILGLAYEIVEDGLGLQALTSPRLYNAAHWGVRVWGLNATYWQANALYHIVFSLLIPITVTNLVFPAHQRRPYLASRSRLVLVAVVAVAGAGLVRVLIPPSRDPGYQAPVAYLIAFAVLVLGLGVFALRVVPPRGASRSEHRSIGVPGLAWLYAGAGLVTLVIYVCSFRILGSAQPAFTHGTWALVPMGAALLLSAAAAVWLARRAAARAWTDRHTLAVTGGALIAHSAGGVLTMHPDPVNYGGMALIIILTVAALIRGDRALAVRATAHVPDRVETAGRRSGQAQPG